MDGHSKSLSRVTEFLRGLGYRVEPTEWDYSDLPPGAQRFMERMWLVCDYRQNDVAFQVFLIELRDYGTHHQAKHPIIESFYRRYPQGDYLFILAPPGPGKIMLVNLKVTSYKPRLRSMSVMPDNVDTGLRAFVDSLHVSHVNDAERIAGRHVRVFDELERRHNHRRPTIPGPNIYSLLLKDLANYPILPPHKQIELARKARGAGAQAESARNELVLRSMRLVIHVASKYSQRGLDFIDLVQEGSLGLMRAINNFNPDHGTHFTTYAVWWIRQTIMRAIADKARVVRLPVHVQERFHTLEASIETLRAAFEREPTDLEVALQSGLLSPEDTERGWLCLAGNYKPNLELEQAMFRAARRISRVRHALREPLSMELQLPGELHLNEIDAGEIDWDDPTIGEVLPAEDFLLIETVWRQKLREKLAEALSHMAPRDREIIVLRYGLLDGQDRTLEEVGQEFGVTRERIRQIETKVFNLLKSERRSKEFLSYLEFNRNEAIELTGENLGSQHPAHAPEVGLEMLTNQHIQHWLSLTQDERWSEIVQTLGARTHRQPAHTTQSLVTYLNYIEDVMLDLSDEDDVA